MEVYDLKKMRLGWFMGNFTPVVRQNENVEIAVKHYKKFGFEGFYYRNTDREIIVILSGKAKINGCIYKKNDIIVFEPKEEKDFLPLTDVECIVIKTPGTQKDVKFCDNVPLETISKLWDYCYNGMTGEKQRIEMTQMKRNINFNEVSVVVQGAIDKGFTKACLESVRKYLPGAKIILSTWEGENVEELEYDKVIFNKDPGGILFEGFDRRYQTNNVNRQLISVQSALKEVKSKYTLKLRSDLILMGNEFLGYFDKFNLRDSNYQLFKSRIIVPELYTREKFYYEIDNKKHKIDALFHPSDWFFFGLTEDLNTYFSETKLLSETEANMIPNDKNNDLNIWNYAPEQYYCISAIKRKFNNIKFDNFFDTNKTNIRQSEDFMLNNFITLDLFQHKILCGKYLAISFNNVGNIYVEKGLLTNKKFLEYYSKLG